MSTFYITQASLVTSKEKQTDCSGNWRGEVDTAWAYFIYCMDVALLTGEGESHEGGARILMKWKLMGIVICF